MKEHYLLRLFDISSGPSNTLMRFTAYFLLLIILSSCSESGEGYKFNPESKHWLQFRGPNASGIAPVNADPPIYFSADTNLLWKTEILPGWSSPCIVNDKIFLTGFNKKDSMLHTFAVNRENGEMIWKDSVRLRWAYELHPVNSYANPTVASDENKVFSHFPGYGLIAFELDGLKCWEYIHKPIAAAQGQGSSPVVRDSLVLVNINQWEDPRIQALDCETGDTVWALRDPDPTRSLSGCSASPVIYKDLIVMHQRMEIVAYNISDQKTEWWLNTPTTGTSTPVIHNDVLYTTTWVHLGEKKLQGSSLDFEYLLSNFDRNGNRKIDKGEVPDTVMVSIRPERGHAERSSHSFNIFYDYWDRNKDGAFDAGEWNAFLKFAEPYMENHGMMAIPVSGSNERQYAEVLWKIIEDTPETPSPLVVGVYVFFIKSGGIITVVNRKSGDLFKKGRIGAAGSYLSSPMLAGNRIYTCSYNGTVTVLSADDFSVIAHNKLKEKIGASPAAVDDVLYVRTDKHLFAFRDQ